MPCKPAFNIGQIFTLYFWKLLFFKMTGGRPMIDQGGYFTDGVTGKSVRIYVDRLGREWMADSGKWSYFRVSR